MPIPNPPYLSTNNPTKEILASSGIYNGISYAETPFAADVPNSLVANTGINSTTTETSTTVSPSLNHALFQSNLTSGNYFIDDMLVFNKYIHYYDFKMFHPQAFLQQSIVTFNRYSLGSR